MGGSIIIGAFLLAMVTVVTLGYFMGAKIQGGHEDQEQEMPPYREERQPGSEFVHMPGSEVEYQQEFCQCSKQQCVEKQRAHQVGATLQASVSNVHGNKKDGNDLGEYGN